MSDRHQALVDAAAALRSEAETLAGLAARETDRDLRAGHQAEASGVRHAAVIVEGLARQEQDAGTCTVCGKAGIIEQFPIAEHPHPMRMWVIEGCVCGARRLAEHEYVDDGEEQDVRVIAATPWRAV